MGYIYEGMDKAKEASTKSFGHKEENYEMAFKFIDARWECQFHQPLHAARHFLNPEIYYSNPSIEDCREIVQGLYECITRLVSNSETQDKILQELNLYKNAQGLFGMIMAKRQRNALSPGKNISYLVILAYIFPLVFFHKKFIMENNLWILLSNSQLVE